MIKISETQSINNKNYWGNLSLKDKSHRIQKSKEKQREYYNSLTENERLELSKRITEHTTRYWNNLSDEEKNSIRKKILLNSKNKLHQKFEEYFKASYISNEYSIEAELIIHKDGLSKSWDYGIYDKNNNLVMVVDLDRAYSHADNCDYDGISSKEEYDEKRLLFVPEKVKPFFILELNFSRSFGNMIKELIINYDEFVEKQFNICRLSPFPYPYYNDKELFNSYKYLKKMDCVNKYSDVSVNTRIGDKLINHFHHSIWSAKCKGSKQSPYDAWRDDDLLREVIRNRIVYINTLNPNKILQGFNIAKKAQKVSVFSAGRAKLLIHKYLNEYDTIFDPFSGFSGRMLGTLSLNKNYIGQDINPIHVGESIDIIEFLRSYYPNIKDKVSLSITDTSKVNGKYDCLFTCPPYGDKEQWINIEPDTRTCDDWIDICLNNYKCNKYLFVVDNTEKYKDKIINTIENKSHFGSNNEYVIMI